MAATTTLWYNLSSERLVPIKITKFYLEKVVLLGAQKVGHEISVSFEKFDVVQALLSFF
jgi:hypothetical protein